METRAISKQNVIDDIKKMISEIARVDIFDLDENLKILEELGIDSLMAIEIIAKCEKHYKIQIDESKLESIKTLGDFINLILMLVSKK
jgi:Phosphopantetheine attachment site.